MADVGERNYLCVQREDCWAVTGQISQSLEVIIQPLSLVRQAVMKSVNQNTWPC